MWHSFGILRQDARGHWHPQKALGALKKPGWNVASQALKPLESASSATRPTACLPSRYATFTPPPKGRSGRYSAAYSPIPGTLCRHHPPHGLAEHRGHAVRPPRSGTVPRSIIPLLPPNTTGGHVGRPQDHHAFSPGPSELAPYRPFRPRRSATRPKPRRARVAGSGTGVRPPALPPPFNEVNAYAHAR